MMGKGKDIKIKEGCGLVETELYFGDLAQGSKTHSVVYHNAFLSQLRTYFYNMVKI